MLCCSRRSVLAGAGSLLTCLPLGDGTPGVAVAQTASMPKYCSMVGHGLKASEMFSTSGDGNLDRALIAELRNIISVIPVGPGFKYIKDPSPNAYATSETHVPGTQGTVLLGMNLIKEEIQASSYGGVAVAGICAHECGHIFQFFSDYSDKLKGETAKLIELHADFIAGYYMGRRRQFSSDRIAVFARSLFAKGDYSYNDPDHHGTPEQRFDALKRGYEVGLANTPFERAVQDGVNEVRRL